MSWDEAKYLREELEKAIAERDRYERLYKQLFGLLVHSDTKLRGLLFGDADLFDPTVTPEEPGEPEG